MGVWIGHRARLGWAVSRGSFPGDGACLVVSKRDNRAGRVAPGAISRTPAGRHGTEPERIAGPHAGEAPV